MKAINAADPDTQARLGNPDDAPALDYYRDAAVLLRKAKRYKEKVALLEDMLRHPGIMYGHAKWGEDRLPKARALRDAANA